VVGRESKERGRGRTSEKIERERERERETRKRQREKREERREKREESREKIREEKRREEEREREREREGEGEGETEQRESRERGEKNIREEKRHTSIWHMRESPTMLPCNGTGNPRKLLHMLSSVQCRTLNTDHNSRMITGGMAVRPCFFWYLSSAWVQDLTLYWLSSSSSQAMSPAKQAKQLKSSGGPPLKPHLCKKSAMLVGRRA
jgi:hypothetical protein